MIKCKTFEDVVKVYGKENLVKVVNIRQIVTYAKMKCQPVWIDEGYEGKLVAFFYKPESSLAWEYWKSNKPIQKNNKFQVL